MSGTIMEAIDSMRAALMIYEVERIADLQREYDGQGCDEGCRLCGSARLGSEVICWWHGVAEHAK